MEIFFFFIALIAFVLSFFVPADINIPRALVRIACIVIMSITTVAAMYMQIPSGSRGVLIQQGKVQGVLTDGQHWIVPYLQTVEIMPVRTVRHDTANATAASQDLQVVHTSIATNYHLNPEKVAVIWTTVGADFEKSIIAPITQESVKSVTSRYTAEELVTHREQVKNEMQSMIMRRCEAYHIIIEPNGVSITNFDFSEQFNEAIEKKQVSQQQAEQQKYELTKAKLQAETEVTRARGEAEASRITALALQSQGGKNLLMQKWIEAWRAGGSQVPKIVAGGNGSMFMIDANMLAESNSSSNKK